MSFEPTEVDELLQVNLATALGHLGPGSTTQATKAAEAQTKKMVGAEAWQRYRSQGDGHRRDTLKLTDITVARSNRRRTAAIKPSR